MGPVDRALRAIVGLILISLTVVGLQTLWGLVGLVPLLTAVAGFCPAYTLLGIKTCRTEDRTA
ncbi:YgaP family membrane protein [Azospirillum largimobile]